MSDYHVAKCQANVYLMLAMKEIIELKNINIKKYQCSHTISWGYSSLK